MDYAVLPPDAKVVTEHEKIDLNEARKIFADIDIKGWKLVRGGNYPCDVDMTGTILFPIVEVLKVR